MTGAWWWWDQGAGSRAGRRRAALTLAQAPVAGCRALLRAIPRATSHKPQAGSHGAHGSGGILQLPPTAVRRSTACFRVQAASASSRAGVTTRRGGQEGQLGAGVGQVGSGV